MNYSKTTVLYIYIYTYIYTKISRYYEAADTLNHRLLRSSCPLVKFARMDVLRLTYRMTFPVFVKGSDKKQRIHVVLNTVHLRDDFEVMNFACIIYHFSEVNWRAWFKKIFIKQTPICPTWLLPWALIAWWHTAPGHRHPCYWLISLSTSYGDW